MKLAARILGTMAMAFVIVPGVRANDDTKPKAKTANESAATVISNDAPDIATATQLMDFKNLPLDFSTSRPPLPETVVPGATAPEPAATSFGAMYQGSDSETYTPRVEWFLGYSFWRAMPTSSNNRIGYLHGGSTSVAYNFNRYLGVVADFAGFDNTRLTLSSPTGSRTLPADGSAYTYMFGPRLSYRTHSRFTPFAQVLVGGAYASNVFISGCAGSYSCQPLAYDWAFAALTGTGFDIRINHYLAIRPIQAEYLLTHFTNPTLPSGSERGWQNNGRFSAGIVLRFGGKPAAAPSVPMSATCSAEPEFVYAGSSDVVVVRAKASNPGGFALNYSWSANEGAIDGTGPGVRWNSSNVQPGTYTVNVRVDNGRNGSASCSATIRVQPRPNRPPTISCSADRMSVTVGDPVQITAMASDPDNDPLTYSWNASGGRIDGAGANVAFQSAGLSPGSCTISGHVDDGRNGTADCTSNIDVQAAQPPPEVRELETRLALHSIYFPTLRPTVENPTGGLVESQQRALLSLAADFSRYLTFKPDAHLILEGHADHRGSIEFNKDLTERRVESTKGFLVGHGIPADHIETRALGKEQNLDAAQVKQLIEQNPDLTDAERQRIEANLQVVVMANNRRVDVSLNTTGQQSVRRYPFNAKDSLTLLSPKGGEGDKSGQRPARKTSAEP
jgi:outer membrane protein OmpA-like peptidoglycan-associated protein/opacity protein-like surface antigen